MLSCVFCKIIKEEIPHHKVYDDGVFMGILDINPNTKGHTLVLPKTHYRWTYDVPNFGEYFEAAKKIAKAMIKGLNASWISFITIGEGVPHAHIHVIPRYENDKHGPIVDPSIHESFSEEEMKEIAGKIFTALES